jgi:hypothetical protein
MTPPSEAERDASLAGLSGSPLPPPPGSELERDMMRLAMIREAKMAGVPWSAVARAVGAPDGKAAKRDARRLARRVQAALLARQPLGSDDA